MRSRNGTLVAPASLLLFAVLAAACTEATSNYCEKASDCTGGRTCNLEWRECVALDGAIAPLDAGTDRGVAIDGAIDAPSVNDVGMSEAGVAVDGGEVIDVAGLDLVTVDAAGTCSVNGDCPDPSKAFCVAGVCLGCQGGLDGGANACTAPTPACDLTTGKCVGCTADPQCAADASKSFCVAGSCTGCNTTGAIGCTARTDGKTVCATLGTAVGQCVECAADGQCTKDPAKGFCVANTCTGCATAGATDCSTRTDGKMACAISGTSAGQCVECTADTQCTKDASKAFCVANACTGCNATGATGCTGRTDGKTTCATTGTAAGQCVECTADTQCTKDAAKGFCVANACAGCNTPGATGCSTRTDGKTVCAPVGNAAAGQCVQCTDNNTCSGSTPICATATNTCRKCATDTDCTGIGPGVCMLDGHCATDAETIYVGTVGTATCLETNPGTALAPVCTAQSGVGLAKSGVVVIRGNLAAGSTTIAVTSPLTIVGRTGGTITSAGVEADGITITSGEVFLRNLTIQGSTSPKTGVGINAGTGGGNAVTLHMDTCAVINNPGGGILLNGAAFDFKDVLVSGNGTGQDGLVTWSGIYIKTLPSTGATKLNLVSVVNNGSPGMTCISTDSGPNTGVYAADNGGTSGVNIANSCGISSCNPAAIGTCGSSLTP